MGAVRAARLALAATVPAGAEGASRPASEQPPALDCVLLQAIVLPCLERAVHRLGMELLMFCFLCGLTLGAGIWSHRGYRCRLPALRLLAAAVWSGIIWPYLVQLLQLRPFSPFRSPLLQLLLLAVRSEAAFVIVHTTLLLLDVGVLTVLTRETLLLEFGCLLGLAASLAVLRAAMCCLLAHILLRAPGLERQGLRWLR